MADRQLAQFVLIDAPPERVWQAWTEPDQVVRWLAESCDLDLDAGRFHLVSGTPGATGEHRVTAVEPGRMLALDWQLDADTRGAVRLELEPHGEGTRLVTRHALGATADSVSAGHLHELWAYQNSLLKLFLELGEAKCRLRSDRTPAPEVRHQLTLHVPASAVFAALTVPEQIRRWNAFAPDARCDGEVGGRYSFGWASEEKGTDGPGEITEYEADRRLTYTWFGDPPTLVRWEIEPLPGSERATRLTLVHSGFGVDQNMLVDYNLGWADFLANLAIWLERGVPSGWSGEAA